MGRCLIGGAVAAAFVTAFVTGQAPATAPDLQAMVDAERTFANAATLKGIRDSFLEFFADDSIALRPTARSAKDELRARESIPFSVRELRWEPRTGDVAASGELGWLTGPSTFIDHSAKDPKPSYGNYLSVWRKHKDGRWRVYIDVGAATPELVSFAPGFVRFPFGARYAGKEGTAKATEGLTAADRALNERLPRGASAAFADVLTAQSRLHRPGSMTIVGIEPGRAWLAAHAPSMSATTTSAESAASGDFGYSYGLYEIKGSTTETGAYVRIWTRDAAGTWWIAADVAQPQQNR